MLNIYAQSIMTATRTGCVRLHDMPNPAKPKRRRWFSRRKTICIEPKNL
jgi:hypothetical protein